MDFVDNGIKSTLVSSVSDDRDAKVPSKLISLGYAQLIFNGGIIFGTHVRRKKEFRFAMINFLARTVAEGVKNSFDGDAIFLGCLCKQDQIIGEEEMRECGAISRGLQSCPIAKSDLRVNEISKVVHANDEDVG